METLKKINIYVNETFPNITDQYLNKQNWSDSDERRSILEEG